MANDFVLVGIEFTDPVSPDPNKCRISGFIVDVTGAPLRNSQIHVQNKFMPTIVIDPAADKFVLGSKAIIRTDSDGFIEFDLYRNAQVDILIPSQSPLPFLGNEDKPLYAVTIPDESSLPFMDLIHPVPDILEFLETSPLVLAVDAEEDVKVKLTLSNKFVSEDLSLITLVSSDDTLVSVTAGPVDDDGDTTIVLTRLATGTVNITATLNLDAVHPRHQPAKTMTFIVNAAKDANGYQVT